MTFKMNTVNTKCKVAPKRAGLKSNTLTDNAVPSNTFKRTTHKQQCSQIQHLSTVTTWSQSGSLNIPQEPKFHLKTFIHAVPSGFKDNF